MHTLKRLAGTAAIVAAFASGMILMPATGSFALPAASHSNGTAAVSPLPPTPKPGTTPSTAGKTNVPATSAATLYAPMTTSQKGSGSGPKPGTGGPDVRDHRAGSGSPDDPCFKKHNHCTPEQKVESEIALVKNGYAMHNLGALCTPHHDGCVGSFTITDGAGGERLVLVPLTRNGGPPTPAGMDYLLSELNKSLQRSMGGGAEVPDRNTASRAN
jgi:hypothetical protein